jgi:hypothetical protein
MELQLIARPHQQAMHAEDCSSLEALEAAACLLLRVCSRGARCVPQSNDRRTSPTRSQVVEAAAPERSLLARVFLPLVARGEEGS